jgi:HlyD family secretion protein
MKSKKILKFVIGIALITIVVLLVGKKQGWFGGKVSIKVAVEKSEIRDIIEVITSNGKVQPQMEVKLSPDVSGEIVELHVKEGDKVVKGDLLLKIKPDNYISNRNRVEASLNNTKARLKQAEAQLSQAKLEFERKEKLWEQKAISDAEYELASTNYNSAKAEKEAAVFSVQSAEASLREAEENLRKTTIYAPISGTVSKLEVELGERVVGTELMTGTPLLRIANMDKMEVLVEVNENDIVRVHHNDTAIIELDAYLGKKFTGLVTEIPVSANVSGLSSDQVTNFSVKIEVMSDSYKDLATERNPYPFRPGMSTTAYIQTSRKSGVIAVPVQSVTTRADTSVVLMKIPEEGEEDQNQSASEKMDEKVVVFLLQEGKALQREVVTGIQDDTYIEIISGIEAGEEVIVAPYSAVSKNLENNSPVEVVEMKDLFKTDKKK